MIGEVDIYGVYVSSVVPTAIIALVATMLLHRLLERLGAYRHIWHPALFDAALFVLFWAAETAVPVRF